ncbi:hypothetical protein Pcinc_037617 [Petrolisthes cinctipes]|uniref:G-protein coupled receptors family 1 profile domain-containing protein n=1 Tax=Petrolisthes cinctipes TaxID=88211 RepID=A0AAE1BSF2_PETCI|nr:hypothetical protein Pcinc_037617 [Petrolisthes cinctipes]
MVGCLPVMGWAETQHGACLFTEVMNYDYLVFLYFCTIVGPGILMAVFYTHIYTVVLKQLRQIAAQEPQADTVSMNSNNRQRFHTRSSSRYDSNRSSTNTNLANQSDNSHLQHSHHQEENLHHYLLRLQFEGALKKSLEEITDTSRDKDGHSKTGNDKTTEKMKNTSGGKINNESKYKATVADNTNIVESNTKLNTNKGLLASKIKDVGFDKNAIKLQLTRTIPSYTPTEQSPGEDTPKYENKSASRSPEEKTRSPVADDESDTSSKSPAKSDDEFVKRKEACEVPEKQCSSQEESHQQHQVPPLMCTRDRTPSIKVEAESDHHCYREWLSPLTTSSPVASYTTLAPPTSTPRATQQAERWGRVLLRKMTRKKQKRRGTQHKKKGKLRSPTRPASEAGSRRGSSLSHVLYQVTHASRREVKAAKSLSIIVLFFMISWFPLYTINCVQAFCINCPVPEGLMFFTIILTHLNSAINPFLYAYHMNDFRQALKRFLVQYVLRKPVDDVFNRSMASAHHYSTHHRVNVGESPHLHTPHSHTPLSGSPLPGTPLDELRSRTSTLGNCGKWQYNSRGIYVSPSHPSSPALMTVGRCTLIEPFRPRAATFTSLTAQAHTNTPAAPRDSSSQPLLSPPVILKPYATQQQHSLTTKQATISNSPYSLQTHQHLSTQPYYTTTPDPLSHSQHTEDKELTDTNIKTTQKADTKGIRVPDSACDGEACCDTEKTYITEATNLTRAPQAMSEERRARDPQSPTFFIYCSSQSLNTDISTKETMIGPSVFVTNSDKQCEKSDCEINCSEVQGDTMELSQGNKPQSTPSIISNCPNQSKEEDTLLIPQHNTKKNEGAEVEESCTLQKHSREDTAENGSHFSLVQNTQAVRSRTSCSTKLMPNGSSCGITASSAYKHKNSREDTASEQLAYLPTPTKTLHNQLYTSTWDWKTGNTQSQDNKGSDSTLPLLVNIDPHMQQGLHKPIAIEETASTKPLDENSPTRSLLPRELSKYLPKILQRQKGSKSGRRGNSWWSDVMRNKSYHGVSLDIKPPDHVKRAQSISGAIET